MDKRCEEIGELCEEPYHRVRSCTVCEEQQYSMSTSCGGLVMNRIHVDSNGGNSSIPRRRWVLKKCFRNFP